MRRKMKEIQGNNNIFVWAHRCNGWFIYLIETSKQYEEVTSSIINNH